MKAQFIIVHIISIIQATPSWSVAHLSLSELGTAQPKLVHIYSFVFYKHWLQLFLQLISKNEPHFPASAHLGQLLLLSFRSIPEKLVQLLHSFFLVKIYLNIGYNFFCNKQAYRWDSSCTVPYLPIQGKMCFCLLTLFLKNKYKYLPPPFI